MPLHSVLPPAASILRNWTSLCSRTAFRDELRNPPSLPRYRLPLRSRRSSNTPAITAHSNETELACLIESPASGIVPRRTSGQGAPELLRDRSAPEEQQKLAVIRRLQSDSTRRNASALVSSGAPELRCHSGTAGDSTELLTSRSLEPPATVSEVQAADPRIRCAGSMTNGTFHSIQNTLGGVPFHPSTDLEADRQHGANRKQHHTRCSRQ